MIFPREVVCFIMKLAVAPGAEVPLIPMDPVQNLENTAFFWGPYFGGSMSYFSG